MAAAKVLPLNPPRATLGDLVTKRSALLAEIKLADEQASKSLRDWTTEQTEALIEQREPRMSLHAKWQTLDAKAESLRSHVPLMNRAVELLRITEDEDRQVRAAALQAQFKKEVEPYRKRLVQTFEYFQEAVIAYFQQFEGQPVEARLIDPVDSIFPPKISDRLDPGYLKDSFSRLNKLGILNGVLADFNQYGR